MDLPKDVKTRLPKAALSIIERAIDGVLPEIDLSPQRAERIKAAMVRAVVSAVEVNDDLLFPPAVTYEQLATEINNFPANDRIVEDYLWGVAQSIACLID